MHTKRLSAKPWRIQRCHPGTEIEQFPAFFWICSPFGENRVGPQEGVVLRFSLLLDWPGGSDEWAICASQHYDLLLDGETVGSGPDSLLPSTFRYEARQVYLPPGRYSLEARVWWAPAQLSPFDRASGLPPAFLLGSRQQPELLSTGLAPWKVRLHAEASVGPLEMPEAFAVGGSWCMDYLTHPQPGQWKKAIMLLPACVDSSYGESGSSPALQPTRLPEQKRVQGMPLQPCWEGPCHGPVGAKNADDITQSPSLPLKVPPHSSTRLLFALDTYSCGRPLLQIRGGKGGMIRLAWAESLFLADGRKGHRDAWQGKLFRGYGDSWVLDGKKRLLRTLPWRAGRYLELTCHTKDAALFLEQLTLERTSFCGKNRPQWRSGLRREKDLLDLCWSGLAANAHETLTDCPYYEQLMYVGDARIQSLCHLLTHGGKNLILQSAEAFPAAQGSLPMIPSRAGARSPQLIPGFSLIWILWLRDIHLWLGEEEWLQRMLPAMRQILNFLELYSTPAGLLRIPPGWLFVDWVPGWERGVPPHAPDFAPGTVQMFYAMALQAASELEKAVGRPWLARDALAKRKCLLQALRQDFFDPTARLWREDPERADSTSLHVQVASVLAGALPRPSARALLRRALQNRHLAPCSYTFQFYLFEALKISGLGGLIPGLLEPWREMLDLGLLTPLEQSEPSRSDCHAWSSHPLYHLPASVLGLRPLTSGSRSVEIAPQPGHLPFIQAKFPLPCGMFSCALTFAQGRVSGSVHLPPHCTGRFLWRKKSIPLASGITPVELP